MDLSFITGYFVPVVMAGCLATGYVVKKYIPTIVFVEGAILNCIVMNAVTVESIVGGAICGLASTGLHQAFKRLIEEEK